MAWVLGFVGAVLGIGLGGRFFGAFGGFAIGWLLGRVAELGNELQSMHQRLGKLETRAAVEGLREAQRASTATPPAPSPAPAATGPTPARSSADPITPLTVPAVPHGFVPGDIAPAATPPLTSPSRPAPAVDAVAWSGEQAPAQAPKPVGLIKPSPASDEAPSALWRWFTEGNVPVKVGMLVLFFGVAALLKYGIDQGWFSMPIELRLLGVAGAALVGLAFGWRERARRPAFGLSLQGGALGILLLTVFTAFRLYHVIEAVPAFVLAVIVVFAGVILAVRQHAVALAVLALLGGYLAPLVLSTGSGNYVALFSYYAVLNAGVFAVAWVRPWRALNLLGFAFTFAIGTIWGYRYYRPENFNSVEPFLILFFLFYVAIAVLYALRQPEGRRGLVDGTLVFGTPLLAFPLQSAMMLPDERNALALSALAVAALYTGLWAWLRPREEQRLLATSFIALAIGFATLAIPIAFSAQWTSCAWALEGAALAWLGVRQNRLMPSFASLALHLLAGGAFIVNFFEPRGAQEAVMNGPFLAGVVLTGSALFSSWMFDRAARFVGHALLCLLLSWLWWLATGTREIVQFVDWHHWIASFALFTGASMLAIALIRHTANWERPWWMCFAGAGALTLIAITSVGEQALRGPGAWAWPLALFAAWLALAVAAQRVPKGVSLVHLAWLFAVAVLAGGSLYHAANAAQLGEAWLGVAIIGPLLLLFALTRAVPALGAAPLAGVFPSYRSTWETIALLIMLGWWLISQGSHGGAHPVAFVPLLNPLEAVQCAILFATWSNLRESSLRGVLRVLAFIQISVMTVRAVHHLAPLPWDAGLFNHMLTQTSLTVVWSVLGVAAWIGGSRLGRRGLWTAGAVIMGLVLAKLVLVDRQHWGNVPGIVSFIVVGLLMTAVGYFAPSPPKEAAK
jgi:uncharacterized membrane protein